MSNYRIDRDNLVELGVQLEHLPEWAGMRRRERSALIVETLQRMRRDGEDPWSLVLGRAGETNPYE
jgi:hypothetical protein